MPLPPLLLTHAGETLTLREWAARVGIDHDTIRARVVGLGWDHSRALTTPPDRRFRKGGRPRADAARPVPVLKKHKASGRAFVRWRQGDRECTRYLGAWGSEEARSAYSRFAAEWAADGAPPPASGEVLLVAGLVVRRLAWAKRECRKGGRVTSEYHCQRSALAPLSELYGPTPAAEFTPAKLRAVRAAMVGKAWARRTCNQHAGRVVAAFGWAAGEGWIPPAVPAALREVVGLKAGKTTAPDHAPTLPVSDAAVAATLPHLSRDAARAAWLAAAIRLQRIVGLRPGEVCGLRPCDLDTAADVWLYTVPAHVNKNAHRSKPQTYWIGPRGQAELKPHLDPSRPTDRVFPISPNLYGSTIRRACRRGKVAPWHPHQLRHALATEAARETGSLSAAAGLIGDTEATAAAHYVQIDPSEKAKIEWARTRG